MGCKLVRTTDQWTGENDSLEIVFSIDFGKLYAICVLVECIYTAFVRTSELH
jgi:hypothetical protein